MEAVKYFSIGILAFLFGIYVSIIVMIGSERRSDQQCRYYNQTIERCVNELGWEKK